MLIVLVILLAIAAFITHKTYRAEKANTAFYTWVVVAVAVAFLAQRMLVLPQHTNIYLAVSILLGHSLGVFLRTWEQW